MQLKSAANVTIFLFLSHDDDKHSNLTLEEFSDARKSLSLSLGYYFTLFSVYMASLLIIEQLK